MLLVLLVLLMLLVMATVMVRETTTRCGSTQAVAP
jgi:hypothetical protein